MSESVSIGPGTKGFEKILVLVPQEAQPTLNFKKHIEFNYVLKVTCLGALGKLTVNLPLTVFPNFVAPENQMALFLSAELADKGSHLEDDLLNDLMFDLDASVLVDGEKAKKKKKKTVAKESHTYEKRSAPPPKKTASRALKLSEMGKRMSLMMAVGKRVETEEETEEEYILRKMRSNNNGENGENRENGETNPKERQYAPSLNELLERNLGREGVHPGDKPKHMTDNLKKKRAERRDGEEGGDVGGDGEGGVFGGSKRTNSPVKKPLPTVESAKGKSSGSLVVPPKKNLPNKPKAASAVLSEEIEEVISKRPSHYSQNNKQINHNTQSNTQTDNQGKREETPQNKANDQNKQPNRHNDNHASGQKSTLTSPPQKNKQSFVPPPSLSTPIMPHFSAKQSSQSPQSLQPPPIKLPPRQETPPAHRERAQTMGTSSPLKKPLPEVKCETKDTPPTQPQTQTQPPTQPQPSPPQVPPKLPLKPKSMSVTTKRNSPSEFNNSQRTDSN